MQKKAITLAVLGVASYGTAHAMDFTSGNNTLAIYGILDGSVYVMKTPQAPSSSTGTTSYGWASNNMTTSRLGFTFTRDLGGGLKAGGTLEQEVEFATGTAGDGVTNAAQASAPENAQTTTWNRSANVFISGANWGELRLGRQYAPSFSMAAAADAFGANSGGYLNSWVYSNLINSILITGAGAVNGGLATIVNLNGSYLTPNIFNDGLSYTSPDLMGFKLKLFQTFGSNLEPLSGNTGEAFSDSGITDITLTYSNAGLTLGIGDQMTKVANSFLSNYTSGALDTNLQLMASYKIAGFKISAAFDKISYDDGYKSAIAARGSGNSAPDNVRIWTLGGTYMFTPSVRGGVSYTSTRDTDNTSNGVNEITAQLNFNVGQDTDIYAQISSANNDGASDFSGVYGSVLPGGGLVHGGDVKTLFAGVRVKF